MKQLYTNEDLAKEFGVSEEEFVEVLQELGVLDEEGKLTPEFQNKGLQKEVEIREY